MPSINKLTDAACKRAQPGPKAQKMYDGLGLYLWVSPKGAKVWRYGYRRPSDGKQQTLTIGPYPLVSLAEARAKRDEARKTLLAGDDPAAPKRAASRRGKTLDEAAAEYWSNRKDITDGYRANVTRAIEMHLSPALGSRPIGSLTRDDLMQAFAVMNAAGLYSYVRKTRTWVAQVFDWAVEHGHARTNPAREIRPDKAFGKRRVQHHAALPLSEVGEFLRRLALEPPILSVLGCELLLLTWVRTTELRAMRWSELDGDLWRIPAARMKRGRDHLVPLSRQARVVLDQLRARQVSEFVFPNDRRPKDRPMSENSILYLIGRMGYGGRLTGHGFRSMASTWANEAGRYRPDAIERQLAHAPDDETRATYNHAEYLAERRVMLQDWANWLDRARQSQGDAASTPASLSFGGSSANRVQGAGPT